MGNMNNVEGWVKDNYLEIRREGETANVGSKEMKY